MSEVYRTQAAVRTRSRRAHWHWPAARRPFGGHPGSACGDHRLAREHGRAPDGVPAEARCRARGCAERWATVEQGPDLMTETEEART